MKLHTLLALASLAFCGNYAYTQSYSYDIIIKGDKAGTLTATKTQTGDKVTYELKSETTIHLVVATTITFQLSCLLENNKLIESTNKTYKNGELHSSTEAKWSNGHYVIVTTGDTTTYASPITHCSTELYFGEPNGTEEVFSESCGIMNKVEKSGDAEFTMINDQNNHITHYEYQNGVLMKVEVDHAVLDFSMVRSD
jgi:hypothetical protein